LSRTSSTGGRYTNYSSTVAPLGLTTSVVVVAGQMSCALVNASGTTTSFGPTASPTGVQANGAEQVVGGCGGQFFCCRGSCNFSMIVSLKGVLIADPKTDI
jgi:hypothetical protein